MFASGGTLEAVEAVCAGGPIDPDDVLDFLTHLVAHHLVVADDAGPDTRYRLLETIRQYAEERLAESGEIGTVRAYHSDHYAEFANVAKRNICGPRQREWGTRLAHEHDNLRAAMTFALGTQDLDRAMRLLCAVPGPGTRGIQIDDLLVFDPAPVLALAGAGDHPGFAHALMETAYHAEDSGDPNLALELADRAIDVEGRRGPYPGQHLDFDASILRARVAESLGAWAESVDHRLTASLHARAAGEPAMEAIALATSAMNLATIDPDAATARATEALQLARRTGMPTASAMSSLALALALAPSDPDRATQLLGDADTVSYENAYELLYTIFVAAILADWPLTLRATTRLLNLDRRSGWIQLPHIAAILNFAARGIADDQPTSAAMIQGAARGLLRRPVPTTPPPAPAAAAAAAAEPNRMTEFITSTRRDATQLIMERLDEAQMRKLRAQGEEMNRELACTYTRISINEYLVRPSQAAS